LIFSRPSSIAGVSALRFWSPGGSGVCGAAGRRFRAMFAHSGTAKRSTFLTTSCNSFTASASGPVVWNTGPDALGFFVSPAGPGGSGE
jgi:hypothetical protein